MANLSSGKSTKRKPSGQYHHGELRQALIDAAGALAERDGIQALTLRSIARELGVTHMAAYHHFADRRHLLAEVASVGYGRLADTMAGAADGIDDPWRALYEVGAAYVGFALNNPGFFRVMFSSDLSELRGEPPLRAVADASYAVFENVLRKAYAPKQDVGTAATASWALVHGLSVLLLDRQLPAPPRSRAALDRLVRDVLRQVRMDRAE